MNSDNPNRRDFLLRFGGLAGAALLQVQWPAVVAAAQHAHEAMKSPQGQKFQVLTAEQAREVDAISARIIPTDEQPGAREAGVVYFIDIALHTFASELRPVYEKGIAEVNKLTAQHFSGVARFSDATPEQQDQILKELAERQKVAEKRFGRPPDAEPDFFQIITYHTAFGYLVDPEGGGNRNYVGWKAIGRDPAHSFAPPFGFYDKDYPGWQPGGHETGKT
jgi:gluconate 2-dehydrogenase gamma chain